MTASLLYSIKLTSHINPRRGYAPYPSFDHEVWSLLLAHAAEVEEVCIFANSFWNGGAHPQAIGEQVSRRINRFGAFAQMSDKAFHDLRRWTHHDGHLSVLYRVRATSDLLPSLVNLYPRHSAVADETRDDLGIKQDETTELRAFVQMHSPEHVVVAFASNADPCYIFSTSPDALHLVLDGAALLVPPSLW